MRHLPLIGLLCSGCEVPAETPPAPAADTAQAETTPDTAAPAGADTGDKSPEKAEPCKVEDGHPTAEVFFCLDGMTCIACDSALELVIKAELSCVLDADLTYDDPPGILVQLYAGMVATEDIVEIIEVDNSLYTVSCIEER
jgi:hypothetical protein